MINHHKGLTSEFRRQLQLAGIQADEDFAQKVLAGISPFAKQDKNVTYLLQQLNNLIVPIADRVLSSEARFELMRNWEQEHPDEDPFPQPLALVILHMIEVADVEDSAETLQQVLKLVKNELYG